MSLKTSQIILLAFTVVNVVAAFITLPTSLESGIISIVAAAWCFGWFLYLKEA